MPSDIEDSEFIDGCGPLRCMIHVLRPLVVPGIATTVLYAFLSSWTEFLGALTFLTNTDLFTLILFVGLQRYYIRGLAPGAVKG